LKEGRGLVLRSGAGIGEVERGIGAMPWLPAREVGRAVLAALNMSCFCAT
jgi:hypothetical protein